MEGMPLKLILSQVANNLNGDRAFFCWKETFLTWVQVLEASDVSS